MHFAQIFHRKGNMGLILHMFFQSVLKSAFLTVSPSRELFGYRMRALHLPHIYHKPQKNREKDVHQEESYLVTTCLWEENEVFMSPTAHMCHMEEVENLLPTNLREY